MENQDKHNINMDIKYGHMELIDVPAIVNSCPDKWFNQNFKRRHAPATDKEKNCGADGGTIFR
jgi:hypothetical protein